ncbi:LOW QUALITY PROTEIN: alkane hydroxylase MAH1-like [Herrania umbratica]|uniref:LOW QUALITY PROTEIN: alkane hydroxylase MAH1-like n=1 Tax=Herrania umbratica TaxID=108875 RepID=A0A6J1B215_9ROSI|nr:LOW QUALITY PROTEIN: alkane hydroxylase MAH1-like [Herrania umbratica]
MSLEISIAILLIPLFLFLGHWYRNRNSLVTNWPIVGMMPALLCNSGRVFEFFTDLVNFYGGTFKFKGPWFPSLDFVLTSDPMNVYHILCRNFDNYEKGSEFREIFEPFGEGIVTSDSHRWRSQRKVLHSLTKNNKKYARYLDKIFWQKLETCLMPVLEHVVNLKTEVDLEDILQRFDYDHICLLALGLDPKTLSAEFSKVPSKVAFDEVEEALLYRNILPVGVWKLQRWLQIGEEKKLSKGLKIVDDFVYNCISSKREKLSTKTRVEDDEFDLLTAFIVEEEGEMSALGKSDKFLRDTAYSFITAGKDAISTGLCWFFWLISTHPYVESKILEEIKVHSPASKDSKLMSFSGEELNKFVYLHATLCETLRLYPPTPVNSKTVIKSDVLPSGDDVDEGARIFISVYSMGRMEEIWGKDCLEFKPERWISEHGDLVHVPSYKFIPFSAGPRVCLGKDLSFKHMKTVAINVLWIIKLKWWRAKLAAQAATLSGFTLKMV